MMLNASQSELLERIGVFFEQQGHQPAVSRIMGLLLLSEPPQLSFEEIQQQLKISKSAVSTALNLLITMELVDYVTHSGERKRYFKIRTDAWQRTMNAHLKNILELKQLLTEVRQQRTNTDDTIVQHLDEVIDFHDFFYAELQHILVKWQTSVNSKQLSVNSSKLASENKLPTE
jgi:DNA-binding transcriptional regulator GbsR (MarR family)